MEAPHGIPGLRPAGAGPARAFPRFAALPAELRCLVWQQAVLADHAERVVPVAHESWRVVPTRRLLAPSAVFAACREGRGEACRLYPLALALLPAALPGVYYAGAQRRWRQRRGADAEATDQSTDEELWGAEAARVVGAARHGRVRLSLERDIFFLGHRHADWAPRSAPGRDAAAAYTTRSLRRAERARVVRVMGTRLGWPYAARHRPGGPGGGRRCAREADARLRATFGAVREIYYFVTFVGQSLPDVLGRFRHAASLDHFCYLQNWPAPMHNSPARVIISKRYLPPLEQEGAETPGQDGDPMLVDG